MTDIEKSTLIARVSKGDELAFRNVFDCYYPNLYTTVLRITKDECMAEDVVQDTFMKVWINKEKLTELDNFEGWLFTVARNITLNVIKKGEFYKSYLNDEGRHTLLRMYPSADYDLQDKDFQKLLEDAVSRLSPKQKQTYTLIKEKFLKRNEVAAILQVSPETVKWNLDQAMKSIRAYCLLHMKDMPLVVLLHFFSKYI